eukprot:5806847-Alexandrium_andersonii.AAC.1
MSASLVGSEMCIRDSFGDVRSQCDPARRSRRQGTVAERTHGEARRHLQAVSYTHLTLPTICSV